jgi:hypothetical protein
MTKNIVTACVLVVLIVMGLIAYAQRHEGCLHGRSLETFKACGSIDRNL